MVTELTCRLNVGGYSRFRLPVKITEAGRETSTVYDSHGNVTSLSIKDTFKTWTMMETAVGVAGLAALLALVTLLAGRPGHG